MEDVFETEGSSEIAVIGRGSGVDSESYRFLAEKHLVVRTRVSILMQVKF